MRSLAVLLVVASCLAPDWCAVVAQSPNIVRAQAALLQREILNRGFVVI